MWYFDSSACLPLDFDTTTRSVRCVAKLSVVAIVYGQNKQTFRYSCMIGFYLQERFNLFSLNMVKYAFWCGRVNAEHLLCTW